MGARGLGGDVVWGALSGKNNAVALKDVPYQGKLYQIRNNLFPFLLSEVRQWPCSNPELTAQRLAANEERFLATWLKGRELSPEARAVLAAAKALYRAFYANITQTDWLDARIETWDVGYYQLCKALKATPLAADERAALKAAHEALRAKLLPQVYALGFLNPDVDYFA